MTTDRPPRRTDIDYSGSRKNSFCDRLDRDWEALADVLDVPLSEKRRFPVGGEARALWEWLEARGERSRLPQALREIGRGDLATELTEHQDQAWSRYYRCCIERWSGPRHALDKRFVRLNLLLDRGEDADGVRWQPHETDLRSVAEVLEQRPDPVLVLLGDPGCGKSTLLRHHELENAQAVLDHCSKLGGAAVTFTGLPMSSRANACCAMTMSVEKVTIATLVHWNCPISFPRQSA